MTPALVIHHHAHCHTPGIVYRPLTTVLFVTDAWIMLVVVFLLFVRCQTVDLEERMSITYQ